MIIDNNNKKDKDRNDKSGEKCVAFVDWGLGKNLTIWVWHWLQRIALEDQVVAEWWATWTCYVFGVLREHKATYET